MTSLSILVAKSHDFGADSRPWKHSADVKQARARTAACRCFGFNWSWGIIVLDIVGKVLSGVQVQHYQLIKEGWRRDGGDYLFDSSVYEGRISPQCCQLVIITMEAGPSKGTMNYLCTYIRLPIEPTDLWCCILLVTEAFCLWPRHASFFIPPFETNASAFLMHAMNDHPGLAFILCTYYA